MTDEVKQLLEDYFSATANLYGIIPLWKFLEIYNSQNEPITEEEFKKFVEDFDFEGKFYDIIGEDEVFDKDEPTPLMMYDLTAEYLDEVFDKDEPTPLMMYDLTAEYLYADGSFDEFIDMRDFQTMFEYYVPKKEKLLRYKDDFFYEKSLEFIDLRAFLRNLPYLTKEQADNIAEDVHLDLCMMKPDEDNWEYVVGWAVQHGFKDKETDNLEKFLNWFCGHTASEVNF